MGEGQSSSRTSLWLLARGSSAPRPSHETGAQPSGHRHTQATVELMDQYSST
jgi:hypothetical protein